MIILSQEYCGYLGSFFGIFASDLWNIPLVFFWYIPYLNFFLFGACLFVSLFGLPFWVCFYILGRSAITFSLDRVALSIRWPVWPSGTVSFLTRSGCSNNVLCAYLVGLPVLFETLLLLILTLWCLSMFCFFFFETVEIREKDQYERDTSIGYFQHVFQLGLGNFLFCFVFSL